jgi:uncharacterized RDD family membrane protein YckC
MNDKARPAGFARRTGALIYDALLILALWFVTLFVLVAISNEAVTGPTIQSILFVELFAFFAYFWRGRGQTLGMLAWHLRLTTLSGQPMTLIQVMLRFIAAMASFVCLGLGHFWVLIDADKRSWPDMFSDTRMCYVAPSGDSSGNSSGNNG